MKKINFYLIYKMKSETVFYICLYSLRTWSGMIFIHKETWLVLYKNQLFLVLAELAGLIMMCVRVTKDSLLKIGQIAANSSPRIEWDWKNSEILNRGRQILDEMVSLTFNFFSILFSSFFIWMVTGADDFRIRCPKFLVCGLI